MSTLDDLKRVQEQLAAIIAGLEHEPVELESKPILLKAIDKAKFFACYREKFGKLKQEQVAPLEFLLDKLMSDSPKNAQEAAYMLATVKRETADTYQPVREAFWLPEAWRKANLRYWPWYGRGFVQLTWERNYKRAGDEIGVDLIADPDKAMEPEIAWEILNRGMAEGWFTGKKLSDYISGGKTDYVEARRIINGTDKAELIAGYARAFEACLKNAGYA